MSKAIALASDYRVVTTPMEQIQDVISANVGTDGITPFDLDRAKVPTGGATTWSVPSLNGTDNVETIEGVIVHWKDGRSYWKDSFEDNPGQPPDCTSADMITGFGEPGGACGQCPLAKFESARKGTGQACTQTRTLFVVRATDFLPLVISAPPMSLGNVKKYLLRLASQAAPYYSVLTRIGLETTKNSTGVEVSRITLEAGGVLDDETAAAFKGYAEALAPVFSEVRADAATPAGD